MILNQKTLLEVVATYLINCGCDSAKTRAYFSAHRFSSGIVMRLPAVCVIPGNKPEESKSNQSHIHVTSKSCEFFYSKSTLAKTTVSTPWVRQNLKISDNNLKALHGEKNLSQGLVLTDSYTMKKIGCRRNTEKQVQLSKLSDDHDSFIKLRKGLYEGDLLVFLKYRNEDGLFAVGIPRTYHELHFEFEKKKFKMAIYEPLESENAIPIKSAVETVLIEQNSNDTIESEELIYDAIYQSLVEVAKASSTTYTAEEYVEQNPEGNSITSHRPPTNPALGKEAIRDNGYRCSVNAGHDTFLKSDGTTYMEVHHIIPLIQQKNFKCKLDTKANIVPLCPNCHRKLHYGRSEDIEIILQDLFGKKEEALKKSGLDITFDNLMSYYR